jgi:6-phosphogluconolactonase
MNKLRRFSSLFIFLSAPLVLLGVSGKVTPSPAKSYRAYVGTYTAKTNSKGIYEFDFDPATGKMSLVQVAAETKDPSWVAVHPSGKYLYSVNETGKESTVSAFSIDPKNGKLSLLNQLPSLGEDPCYLSFDKTAKFLFVANYTSGNVAVFPILADGKLGEHTALQKDSGTLGPNKERQDGPHAHWIGASGGNRAVYVSDLGLDSVLIYDFDPATGHLKLHDATVSAHRPFAQNTLETKPGTGPRHLTIGKRTEFGQIIYALGELDSTITVFRTSKEGIFASIQKDQLLPAGFSNRNDAAEIEIHPNGKLLYASNRGHDSIAVYAIDQKTGLLTYVADVPTGGKEPRHFAIDPTGKFLLAENQLSDTIVEFRIDPATGKLTPTGETLTLPSPVCLTFVPTD